jgi:hypothetical protein
VYYFVKAMPRPTAPKRRRSLTPHDGEGEPEEAEVEAIEGGWVSRLYSEEDPTPPPLQLGEPAISAKGGGRKAQEEEQELQEAKPASGEEGGQTAAIAAEEGGGAGGGGAGGGGAGGGGGGGAATRKEALIRFYKKHDKAKIPDIAKMLKVAKYEDIQKAMLHKYGEAAEDPEAVGGSVAVSTTSVSEMQKVTKKEGRKSKCAPPEQRVVDGTLEPYMTYKVAHVDVPVYTQPCIQLGGAGAVDEVNKQVRYAEGSNGGVYAMAWTSAGRASNGLVLKQGTQFEAVKEVQGTVLLVRSKEQLGEDQGEDEDEDDGDDMYGEDSMSSYVLGGEDDAASRSRSPVQHADDADADEVTEVEKDGIVTTTTPMTFVKMTLGAQEHGWAPVRSIDGKPLFTRVRHQPTTARVRAAGPGTGLFNGQPFTVSARSKPDWKARRTGRILRPLEEFKISQRIVVPADGGHSGQSFYKLADGSGWVFRYTLTGEEIVEEISPPVLSGSSASGTWARLGKSFGAGLW